MNRVPRRRTLFCEPPKVQTKAPCRHPSGDRLHVAVAPVQREWCMRCGCLRNDGRWLSHGRANFTSPKPDRGPF